jgi:hypothetical protein
MKPLIAILSFAVLLSVGRGSEPPRAVDVLPIKVGDSIETVRSALKTDQPLQDEQNAAIKGSRSLRLKTRGIWVFFDPKGFVYTIRLESPFTGKVGGLRIGDSKTDLVAKLGPPAKIRKSDLKTPHQPPDPYIYYLDDTTTARFDFDRDEIVVTMFLIR